MHYLIYISSATHPMGEDELANLLETSRMRNIADGITGMLLYKNGSFMQLLEGDRDKIFQTYERIGRDTRHCGLSILRQGKMDERNCPEWSMGFRSVNAADLECLPGFSQLSNELFTSLAFTAKPHLALRLLKSFNLATD